MRLLRLIDWRFLVCLIVLLMVATLSWSFMETAREDRAKGARIDALVQTIQTERADAQEAAAQAEQERARLLAEAQSLHRQYSRLEAYQTALVRYLRSEGIDLPVRFVRVPVAGPRRTTVAPRRTITSRPPVASEQPPSTGSGKSIPGKAKGHKAQRKSKHGKRK